MHWPCGSMPLPPESLSDGKSRCSTERLFFNFSHQMTKTKNKYPGMLILKNACFYQVLSTACQGRFGSLVIGSIMNIPKSCWFNCKRTVFLLTEGTLRGTNHRGIYAGFDCGSTTYLKWILPAPRAPSSFVCKNPDFILPLLFLYTFLCGDRLCSSSHFKRESCLSLSLSVSINSYSFKRASTSK